MEYVAVEQLLDKCENSIYKLAILASKRALEIAEGQPRLVVMNAATKPSSVALREISENKVRCRIIKAAAG